MSADRTRLIAVGDHTIVWNAMTGALVARVGQTGVTDVTMDRFFVIGSSLGLLTQWEIPQGRITHYDGGLPADPNALYSPEGFLQRALQMDVPVNQIAIIPDSHDLLVLSDDGRLHRLMIDYNLLFQFVSTVETDGEGDPSFIVVRPEGGPRLILHPTQPLAAYAGSHQDVVVYNYEADRVTGQFPLRTSVACLDYNADGSLLLVGTVAFNSTLYLLDATTLDVLAQFPTNANVVTCRFNNNGSLIATGSASGEITLWGLP